MRLLNYFQDSILDLKKPFLFVPLSLLIRMMRTRINEIIRKNNDAETKFHLQINAQIVHRFDPPNKKKNKIQKVFWNYVQILFFLVRNSFEKSSAHSQIDKKIELPRFCLEIHGTYEILSKRDKFLANG